MSTQFDLFNETENDIFAAKDYHSFKELIKKSNCTKCELHRGRRNIVIDRGDPSSRIMCIGEARRGKRGHQGQCLCGEGWQTVG